MVMTLTAVAMKAVSQSYVSPSKIIRGGNFDPFSYEWIDTNYVSSLTGWKSKIKICLKGKWSNGWKVDWSVFLMSKTL